MLNRDLIDMIEERHGRKLVYSNDCEALSEHIFAVTGERLSIATLKRMFGFVGLNVEPRKSTMDIIAQYVGYQSYELLISDTGRDTDISEFSYVDEVVSDDLTEGSQIQITYEPGRLLVMTYLGDNYFIINESYKSKLLKGDKVRITHFTKGFELLVSNVIRDGNNIGPYQSAKAGGLTSIEVFK